MPKPHVVPSPDPDDAGPASTVGWAKAKSEAEPKPLDEATVAASTPGPERPERQTANENTVRSEIRPNENPQLPEIPGFHIEKEIGRGGMGTVYRATDLVFNRVVALKLITPGGRDESAVRGRFGREVQGNARIDHPNIVPVYQAGSWHGFPFFTMKYIPGGALSKHASRFVDNPTGCAKVVGKVARALQALHDHNVIHRDLKPLNILLAEGDEPMVADFGLAKWLDEPSSDLSYTGFPLGTRQYMAPEQTLGGKNANLRLCDIWALGVTLYEMLAGQRPFPDDGVSDLFVRIREDDPPSLPDSVPPELAAIVLKCLAKNPTERYPTAAAVANDLENWLAEKPISVAAAKRHSRGWRVVAGLALLVLIAVPAYMSPRDLQRVPSPQKPSIAERLRAGEVVTLIGATGLPVLDSHLLPGCNGAIVKGQNGFATFTSDVYSAVELSSDDLPWPVKLRAEYALISSHDTNSFAGVYVGGKLTPGAKPCESLIELIHHEERLQTPSWFHLHAQRERVAFELLTWDHAPWGTKTTMPKEVQRPHLPEATPDWYPVEIVIDESALTGKWNGLQLTPLSGPIDPNRKKVECLEWWLAAVKLRGVHPNFQSPYIGAGLGICVMNATAAYRNVTIESSAR